MIHLALMLAELSPEKRAAFEAALLADGSEFNVFPQSFAQQRLWFLDRLQPGSAVYNVPAAMRLEGSLRVPLLQRSLDEILRRHEALRTTFGSVRGKALQVISPELVMVIPEIDLSALPEAARGAEARRLSALEADRPFDLEAGPLVRLGVLRLGAQQRLALLTMHHIVSDGWSLGVFVRELAALYTAFAAGRPSPLPELPIQYADYAAWQREHLSGLVLEEKLAAWRHRLGSAPAALDLPTDRPRPPVQKFEGGRRRAVLGTPLAAGLRRLGQGAGTTLFMTLLAGLDALLARWVGVRDLVVGSPVAGRQRIETEGLIGFFVNMLALRTDLSGDPAFCEVLRRVQETALEAYAHEDLPFEKLVEELAPERDLSRSPLFQVMLILQEAAPTPLRLPGLTVVPLPAEGSTARLDLTFMVAEADGGLGVVVEYDRGLFDATTVARLLGHFETLLAGTVADPGRRLSELPLLSAAERAALLREWNDTALDLAGGPLHRRIETQAALRPDAWALTCCGERLTYAELDGRASRLARWLRRQGVGAESPVGIALDRTASMVVALLAVLKAGGAYVPLDPSYPAERIAMILEDSGARVVLTSDDLAQAEEEVRSESGSPLAVEVPDEGLAYVLFTSGSTGRPKGVQVAHAALVNFLESMRRAPGLGSDDCVLAVTSLSFDIAALEIWLPLLAGARVEVARREETMDGALLAALLSRSRATLLQATPATWRLLLAAGWEGDTALKALCGGEALPADLAERLLPRVGALWNLYGPTETTVWSSVGPVLAGRPVSLGRPVANTRILVLSDELQPVPAGVAGELCIGGLGLARGYRGRPDLTAESFVPDPLAEEPGARLYRTGDLVRHLGHDGIEFLGRRDQQVKVRGFRIELGEIEAALAAHPGVAQAVAAVRRDAAGEPYLAAWVVPAGGEEAPPAAELRAWLSRTLPEHMMPSVWATLAVLPLTPNRKVDRRALPDPGSVRAATRTESAPPGTELERTIARVWAEVLGRESFGVDDNFFDVGGHSLRLMEVQASLARALGRDVPVVELFRHTTIRRLADHLAGDSRPAAPARRAAPVRAADLAVVGMAARFPGAGDPAGYWLNLRDGVESVRRLSAEELRGAGRDPDQPALVGAEAVLDGIDLFDAGFFGYSAREAEMLDPQQRLLLECAWECLEQAGYDPERYPGRIGVFAGARSAAYAWNLLSNRAVMAMADGLSIMAALDKDHVATRLAYELNLRGPGITVQTACSTSLVAVHLARQALLAGECEMALAGGVSLRLPQAWGYLYQEGGIHSPDGRCRAFDAAARGTVFGSGLGLVLLKRLDDALRDGDQVHAVLKGSAVNNDGSLKVGYTAPSVDGQAEVIALAQAAAGVGPETIGLVEAHGTGTPLGDPVEVAALRRAFGETGRAGFCALGSVKTNFGHLDTAAGIAGLLKVVLALKHRQIPPSLHFERPNPAIDFASSPFYVSTRLADWPVNGTPRRAGVSSFGIGGTNAHAVLEEAPPAEPSGPSRPWQLLLLSARTREALDRATARLAGSLEASQDIADIAWTLQIGRRSFEHRRMLVCRDAEDACRALAESDPGRVLTRKRLASRPAVVFLFPGQGAQHAGMGRELYAAEPEIRRQVDLAAELLRPRLGRDLRELLLAVAADELQQTRFAQLALFVLEHALARLWISWGVRPWALIGHSVGELVAACLAGVMSLEDALELVALRGDLMQGMPTGAMLSVDLPEPELLPLLGPGLSLAAVNSPSLCVASGSEEEVAELEIRLEKLGAPRRRLHTSHAFHSAMMEPAVEPFRRAVERMVLRPPAIPYVSNVTGTWITAAEATDPGYWAAHLRGPVRFGEGMARLLEEPATVLLEVGPGRTLSRMAQAPPGTHVAASMRRPGDPGSEQAALLEALGRLWLAGVEIDWEGFHTGERRRRVSLPTYPFQRQRYWIDPGNELGQLAASPGAETRPEPVALAGHSRPELSTSYEAPRDETERRLAEIWQELLGFEPVGVHDDFFELGGHSLLATRLASRIREAFGAELPLERFFGEPTIARLAGHLREAAPDGSPPIAPIARDRPLPLSFSQERLWFLDQMEPGTPALNLSVGVRLLGRLDAAAFARALRDVSRRHETLRTTFPSASGEPRQRIAPESCLEVPRIDLSALPEAAARAAVTDLAAVQARLRFDLARGPLVAAWLLRLAADEHAFFLNVHHIVADGWSMRVLIRDATALYGGSPLPDLPIQYADYAVWQRERLALEDQLVYWKSKLGGELPVLDLPTDRPRPPGQTFRGSRAALVLPPPLATAIRELGRREGASPFMVLLAAFSLLLHRYGGQDEVLVGTPIAGRGRTELEGLIGIFLNTLVLRVDHAGGPTFAELLARVRGTALEAYAHQDLPFERLLKELRPERDLSRTPLFQVFFNMLNLPELAADEAPDVTVEELSLPEAPARFDLTLYAWERRGTITFSLVYNGDLFDEARMRETLAQLEHLLEQAVADPDRRIAELSLVTRSALAVLPDPAAELPADWRGSIQARFVEWARREPERLAVVDRHGQATYGEILDLSGRVARCLTAGGVERGDVVVIYGHRSAPLVWAVLGVLRAGAAMVILDPAYPAARLRQYVELARPRAWIRIAAAGEPPEALRETLAWLPERRRLDLERFPDLARGPLAGPAEGADVPVGADDLAYISFTSGSTGVPKGVLGRHGPLTHFQPWHCAAFGLGPEDRFSLLSALSHDPLQRDLFTPFWLGDAVCIPDPDRVGDSGYLAAWMAEQEVTVTHLTPAMGQLLTQSGPAAASVATLRRAFFVGDILTRGDVDRMRALAPGVRCVNFYGSTETQRSVAFHLADGEAGRGREVLPLGRGIEGVQLLVLDPRGDLAGIGERGEIHVRSAHLARGYLGDEALTRERFFPNPATGAPVDRLYRTGDFGRYLPDGEVEFLGRADHEIKIRGFRVDLGEIGAALARHPEVREAVVLLQRDARGGSRLAAWLTPHGHGRAETSELRAFLRERLPEYMVPSAYVWLDRLPMTPNGKLDRRALPVSEPERGEDTQGFVPPGSAVEEVVAAIWAELLQVDSVGLHDSFFDLGGHSLLATRMTARLAQVFRVELPLRRLFEQPTVAGVARCIEEARVGGGAEATPLRPRAAGEPLRLSFAQERLWFLDRLAPGGAAYNLPFALRVAGDLDAGALERSLTEVVRRHEVLRTAIGTETGIPVPFLAPAALFQMSTVDLSGLPEMRRDGIAEGLIRGEARRPFDLAQAPLLRAALLRLAPGEHLVLLTLHHVAGDGWSIGILVRELAEQYRAALGGPVPSPAQPVQYADFAAWQRERLSGPVLEEAVAWWRERLSGAPPVLELPFDRPRPVVQSLRGEVLPVRLPADLAGGLASLGRERGATLFMGLLACVQALLARASGQSDVSVGTPVAGRGHVDLERLIGLFVNTLVLRADLSQDPGFGELVEQARDRTLEAHAHQHLPFEKLVEALQPERSLSHSPLFQVLLVWQNLHFAEVSLPGLTLSPLPPVSGGAKFDLSISLWPAREGIGGALEYDSDLFDRGTVERLWGWFETMLRGALAAPSVRLSDLPWMTAAERDQLLLGWNDTGREVPGTCLHELIQAQVERTPDAVAVVCGEESVTYAELDRRASELARQLRRLGVGSEGRVAVCLERSVGMVAGLLGVLKAGGAYVPLDPSHPAERRSQILEDSGADALLTEEGVEARRRSVAPPLDPLPENLAYILFTSGSTGRPKGVQITHESLVNFLASMRDAPGLRSGEALLAVTSPTFDIAALELWLPLMVGGRVELATQEETVDGGRLAGRLARSGAVAMQATPATWQLLLASGWMGSPGLRALCGGEALPGELARELLPKVGELWNLYGPTETTVWSAVTRVRSADRDGLAIGRPVANTQVYILDRGLRPLPVGVAGELCIGGRGLARGYLGRPDLTAERFVPDPWISGCRLYRTGDLVRHLPGGGVEFLGRSDHQVKLRGFRIELGEIEETLARHPDVAQAVVALEHDGGEAYLAAWVVPLSARAPEPEELRGFLARSLPDYMLPSAWMALDAFPLTPNRKIDRRALPRAGRALPSQAAAQTPVEEILAALLASLLGLERVGRDDDFFRLGGHSLLALQLVSRIRDVFGVDLSVRAIFERPRVMELAGLLREGTASSSPLAPIHPRPARVLLSHAQERLWFVHQLDPGTAAFNLPSALRLEGPLDVQALENALGELTRRHESLRTTFAVDDGEPVQVVAPSAPFRLARVDLAQLDGDRCEAAALALAQEEIRRPFDLQAGPLLRALLMRVAPDEHLAVLTMHHIIGDGWSTGVLVRELTHLYAAFAAGAEPRLPELPVQYADFALWQRRLTLETLEPHLAYWRSRLADAPAAPLLPADRPRPEISSTRGATLPVRLAAELGPAVRELCRREGVTPFMVLMAGFQVWLRVLSGQEDLLVGTDFAGRDRTELEPMIGFFVNQLVLRGDLSGNPSFREVLARVRTAALEAYAHQEAPFDRVVASLGRARTADQRSLYQVKLILQNGPVEPPRLDGLRVSPVPLDRGAAQQDLVFAFWEVDGQIRGWINYATDLFEPTTISRWMEQYDALLRSCVSAPETRLDELEQALRSQERRRAMENRSHLDFSRFKSARPEAVGISPGSVVTRTTLQPGQTLPLVIMPAVAGVDLVEWAGTEREEIERDLLRHGAILFRGFGVDAPEPFERFASTVCTSLFDDNGEHPHDSLTGNVYTPVFYSPGRKLLWHNENSFNFRWPRKILFCCAQPAEKGGETPLVDSRKVFEALDPAVRERFMELGVAYHRNYGNGLGLDWQEVFRTDDPQDIERYCRENRVDREWVDGERLRTRCLRPAAIAHPDTAEMSWFNQAQHWHLSCLDADTRESLTALFPEEDLPRNCTFGTGESIPDEHMASILDVYRRLEVSFPWQKGDVLLVDNVLTAHARNPYEGSRKLLVAMGEMASFAG